MPKVLGLEYEDLAAVFKGIGNIAGVVSSVREQERQQKDALARQQAKFEADAARQAGIDERFNRTDARLREIHDERMEHSRSTAARTDDRYHQDRYLKAEDDARKERIATDRFNRVQAGISQRHSDKQKPKTGQGTKGKSFKRTQPISDATLFRLWQETMTDEQKDEYDGDFLEYRDHTLRTRYSYDPRTEGMDRENRGTGDFRRQEAADDRAAGTNQGSAFPDGYNRYSAAQPEMDDLSTGVEDDVYNEADFAPAAQPKSFEEIVARAETEISDWADLDEDTKILILDIMMQEEGLEVE